MLCAPSDRPMSIARIALMIGTLVLALSTLWTGQDALAHAPEQCVCCTVAESPDDVPTDAYGALMHRLDLAGDPPDSFVAEMMRPDGREARPEHPSFILSRLEPLPARVPLRPPRVS